MKVFINGRFLSQRRTGVQRYAFEILHRLDHAVAKLDRLSTVRVIVVAPNGTPAPRLARLEYHTVGPLSGHAWEQVCLPIVTGSSLLIGFGSTGPLLKRNQLVTMHDAAVFAVPHSFGRFFRWWYQAVMPWLARRARYLMTVSEFSRSELLRHLGSAAQNARVSGEGCEHVLRTPPDIEILTTHGLRPRHYVLAVGSITPHKNLAILAEAASQLEPTLDVEVVVAGAADPAVFRAASGHRNPRLRCIGYVTDSELRALYEHAAAFVHPSTYEGFGIPPLEAMALGCPVLCSHAAALTEVCGDAAWYFAPNDARRLAVLIQHVLVDPNAREQLVLRGKQQALSHSWDSAARHFLDVVVEELQRHQPSSAGNVALPEHIDHAAPLTRECGPLATGVVGPVRIAETESHHST